MPVMKYSEIALAVAFAVLAATAWLIQPRLPPTHSGSSAATGLQPMIVVVITGKRLSPEEKRLSLMAE